MALDEVQALKDDKEGQESVAGPYMGLIALVKERWNRAVRERLGHERRWLRAYRNFRGLYGPDVMFRESEKSRVFVKITKTKVLASYGQLLEVLFAGDKFPIGIIPSEKPVGVSEYAHIDPNQPPQSQGQDQDGDEDQDQQQPQNVYGWNGDGRDIPPGATYSTLLGGLQQEYGKAGFTDGPAPDLAHMPQISPAEISAKEMEKVIQEQLEESDAGTVLRHAVFEMVLLGHCIVKGPFSFKKISHRWIPNKDGGLDYSPMERMVPTIEAVSCWYFYPDPDAVTLDQCEWVIQRHALGRSHMRGLLNKPYFRDEAVRSAIALGPNYIKQWFEDHLRDDISQTGNKERYEVFEYWGVLDKNTASVCGIDGLSDDDLDEVQVNIWICGNQILRMVINPFTPAHIPYQACPYELNPYQFWGVGLPENMDDCQTVMNGHARMAIDNLALAGHLVFDIDEQSLVPGQDMKIYPGKIFRRQSGQPGQAIFGVKFPSTAQDNLMMFDKFRQLSDEATGIPSYSHGATGVQSTTRTASGMSMLMGAAALNIKTVVKNIDDYLLGPLGEYFFHWNMQFNDDVPEIRGDLEIKARGTSALMQKEVRSQRLMTFMQLTANPAFAPYIKAIGLLKEIADSLDIDPKKLINDPEEAAIYARMIGQMNGQGSNPSAATATGTPGVGENGGPPQQPSNPGTSGNGGGNIGTGNVPQPGQSGFTANANQATQDGTRQP
jgi:hypothetical protein